MNYTQRKLSVSFFISLFFLLLLFHSFQQKLSIWRQQQLFYKVEFCSTAVQDFVYDAEYQVLYQKVFDFRQHITVQSQNLVISNGFSEINEQKYIAYFIDESLESSLFQIDNKQCEVFPKSFFFLTMIQEAKSSVSTIFFDKNFYFIRRDQSYICNAEIIKDFPRGKCHEESFYIDLSYIV